MLFEYSSIRYLSIQTIDKCNLRCEFCPNRYRAQSGQIMEDEVFEKILIESKPYMAEDSQIVFHLENEPLLDKKIFERIKLARDYFPGQGTELFMSSNGVLAEKHKDQIISHLNIYNNMQYGENHKKFNKFTKSEITKEKFDRVVEANKEIVETMNHINETTTQKKAAKRDIVSFTPKPGINCHSRAGFLDGWKIKTKTKRLGCKKQEPDIYFNFLSNGDMILCCMDYIRESVLGNIKYKTLEEIFSTKKAQNIIKRARGEVDSEENFICRRCRYSYPL